MAIVRMNSRPITFIHSCSLTFYTHRSKMSSALPLIILGQVYLLSPASNISTNGSNSTQGSSFVQNINQLSGPLPQVIRNNGYRYTPGVGAHKFHAQAETWYTALLICREEGGHLAIINSQAESQAIADLFADAGAHLDSRNADYAWVGFHDLFGGQGRYETVLGEYVENVGFNEWKLGERNDFGSYCGLVHKHGKLSADSGSYKYAFVCELPLIPSYMEQTDGLTTMINPV